MKEGKLREGALRDESSVEYAIDKYIYDMSAHLKELQSLEPQQSMKSIQEIISSIKYLTEELDIFLGLIS